MSYTVAVRALCEFSAKHGDLDLRFTPSPSAQEGIAGHALVASRRGESYETELPLAGSYRELTVRGRADGYDPTLNQLEEVKTFRGDLRLMPDNHRHLHWAQLRIYGCLLCRSRQLAEVRLALVYFDIGSQRETVFLEVRSAAELEDFFDQHCQRFLYWARRETDHRQQRDNALTSLGFPHPDFRAGQRELAETVYKSVSTGRCAAIQAPTGIGKTMGTLFPMLKAMPVRGLDKVFFLTAKTPGRQLALAALEHIRARQAAATGDNGPGALRMLELVARDKACEHPGKACHGDACPLARGFYDRLAPAREEAATIAALDRETLRQVALRHEVCPYYLGQEMARWCDVVVGDYNYYFDFSASLYHLATAGQWQVGVLVDEAHNLVERGRGMYSATLQQADLRRLRQSAPAPLKKPLTRLNRHWNALVTEALDDGAEAGYRVCENLPTTLIAGLQQLVTAIGDYWTEHPGAGDARLQAFYFDALHFCRVAELFDSHFLFDIQIEAIKPATGRRSRQYNSTLCLRNVVPAALLAPRFGAARSVVLFSATLKPTRYYHDLLGLPDDTAIADIPSPFDSRQLSVNIVCDISTRFRNRARSVSPIAHLMERQFRQRPGNYLAFFSSFDYLEQVAEAFQGHCGDVPVWLQSRRMTEAEREAFLDRFTSTSRGIGFAVLGGAFGEGIDLPGARLIGAFIATLGMAQVNAVNQQLSQRIQHIFGAGFDYTYLYPGLQKVIQAAGRVIRTEQDRGQVFLIDDRFAGSRVRKQLPGWWHIDNIRCSGSPFPAEA